jgi:hypothetical protein
MNIEDHKTSYRKQSYRNNQQNYKELWKTKKKEFSEIRKWNLLPVLVLTLHSVYFSSIYLLKKCIKIEHRLI